MHTMPVTQLGVYRAIRHDHRPKRRKRRRARRDERGIIFAAVCVLVGMLIGTAVAARRASVENAMAIPQRVAPIEPAPPVAPVAPVVQVRAAPAVASIVMPSQVMPEVVPAKPVPARHASRTHRHAAAAPTRTAAHDDVSKPKREKVDFTTCAKQVLGCIDRSELPQPKKPRKL